MKCEICNKAIKGDCQFINGAYYHNMCLEQVIVIYKIEQKVLTHTEKQLEMQLDKWNKLKKHLQVGIINLEHNLSLMYSDGLKQKLESYKYLLSKMEETEEE